MVKIPPLSVAEILEAVSGRLALDRTGRDPGEIRVTQLAEPLEAGAEALAFVIAEGYLRDVARTGAGVLVVQESLAERVAAELPPCVRVCIACADAYLGLARVTELVAKRDFYADWRLPASRAGAIATSEKSGLLDPTARVAPGAVICDRAEIGPRTVILPNVVVGPEAKVGADCVLFPGVVLYPRTTVGARVRLHAGVVLGSDGFGYARGAKGSEKIWHLGRVVVGDDVEIGAGTTVDRGTLKDTVIENGAKIDNLVQIGHNGHIKSHAILCAQVGMAGNVTVGRGAILAGKAGVADKIEIGDGAVIGPMTGLSKDIKPGEQVMGQHIAKPRREWWKLLVLFERLPELYERVKRLERGGGAVREATEKPGPAGVV